MVALQADVKQQDGRWVHFDDDKVTPVQLCEVLGRQKDVYLLFYQLVQ
jgi:ubiquitin C-terminal hydrolase